MNPKSSQNYTVQMQGIEPISNSSYIFETDVYAVLRAFGITDPALAHALKKLLMLQKDRGHKNPKKDSRCR